MEDTILSFQSLDSQVKMTEAEAEAEVASGHYTQSSCYNSSLMNPTKSSMNKVVKAARNAKRDRNTSEPMGGGLNMPPVYNRAPMPSREYGEDERLSSAMGPPLPQLKTHRLKSRNKASTSHNVAPMNIKQQTVALKQHIVNDNDAMNHMKVRSSNGASSSVPTSSLTTRNKPR